MPDLALRYDAVQLYDMGFGPCMVSVTSPEGGVSPSSTLSAKNLGKAPGRLTPAGWTSLDVNNPKFRCVDYNTAKLWRDNWGANVGFVVGDGFVVIDNDQGKLFSDILQALLFRHTGVRPLRRYVLDPKHDRDAFFVRVVDFVGDPAPVRNHEIKLRNGVLTGTVQFLAQGKQSVIAGIHPGVRAPYVWNRELIAPSHIPLIELHAYDDLHKEFYDEVRNLGWDFDKPVRQASVSAPVSAPTAATGLTRAGAPGDAGLPSKLLEAEAFLDEIPNRDAPPGEPPNGIDRWLDAYENWTSVGYALAAFLGAPLMFTPEALALWIKWSDGRAQLGQTSESVWRSVLGQALKFGPLGLVKLVRSLVPAPTGEQAFPDLEPDDPALQTRTPVWDYLEARWCYCRSQGFIDIVTRDVVSRQAFSDDNAHLARALAREIRPGHRGRSPSVADLFVAQSSKRRVRSVTYAPGDPAFIPSADPDLPEFNLWRATTHGTLSANASDVAPWLDHVEFVTGSQAERSRFLRWCAFTAQHPELKPNWHFLIMSLQGVGKDTLVQPVKLAVGDGNWKETLIFKLSGEFNTVVQTKFLIIGETRQSDTGFTSPHDVGTRLKELLARPPETLEINKKHQQPYEIPNRLAVILFSNEENPLYLERGQRRVHVVNRRDAKIEPPGYYQTLWQWLQQGGAELAAAYLLRYPLSEAEKQEFIGGVAPSSDAKAELEHLNIHPALSALEEILADAVEGKGPFASLVATQKEIADHLAGDGRNKPSSQLVGTWLLDMERRKTGVRRLKIDPNAPHRAGHVGDGKHTGRLWLLGEKAPGGRAWNSMTNVEIVALWKNLPAPPNATVTRHPAAKFPDEEEPV